MAGPERTLVDANVLLYAHDASEVMKQPIARAALETLWRDRAGVLSTQVLQELYVAATRKLRQPLSRDEAREIVELYATWPVITIDPPVILAATRVEEDAQVSSWDALILTAARLSGATRLLTEDLQHGREIDGVRLENPFATLSTTPPASSRPIPAGSRKADTPRQ